MGEVSKAVAQDHVTFWTISSLDPELSIGAQNCYGNLGCFPVGEPWSGTIQRPFPATPWPPKKIGTRFFLFTQENLDQHQVISAYNTTSIVTSFFKTTRKTCFIIHGMADKAEDNWVPTLCRAILYIEDINCIAVDWRNGSGDLYIYPQAANNVRVVGAEIAYLLTVIQEKINSSYPPSSVYLIGHSLGAQVAGETGKRFKGIGRITALDPAGPYFEDTPAEVCVEVSDAGLVDVVHTDSDLLTGLGVKKPVGHYDYFPNGGKDMPGCPSKVIALLNITDLRDAAGCDHSRVLYYFKESVRNPDGFLAFPCDSYDSFNSSSCFPCPASGCPYMGYFADLSHGDITKNHQTFYFNTGGDLSSLPRWRYKLSFTLRGRNFIFGLIYIYIFATGGQFETTMSGFFSPGSSYSRLEDVEFEFGIITQVAFKWSPTLPNLFSQELGAEKMHVQRGKDGVMSSFCSEGTVIDDIMQTLGPCLA
ncbi:pancreatic lipase-related protein 2-like [Spea bombifrons]|uniref:pancreatic lipase-related protein 2-like n=1 Tax=Spea bombifrons TaxID=233779 RepID=UPI0023494F3A|nr:pancreatic lipase-related protein 2-like [Spea bombifrons]